MYKYKYIKPHHNLFPLLYLLFLHSTMACYIMHNYLSSFSPNYHLSSLRAGALSPLLPYPQCPEQCLAHGKHSVNIYGGNDE